MARKKSAGIALYRFSGGELQVFLVHPGGPYWARKDDGAWSIPKGELQAGDAPLQAAVREFTEETGSSVSGELRALPPLRQPSGKLIYAWAVEGDFDPAALRSNLFTMEWPPRSGNLQSFPEVDRGGWFNLSTASWKILPGQRAFLEALRLLAGEPPKAYSQHDDANRKHDALSG